MMRLVFLFFAEERDLLPMSNPVYRENFYFLSPASINCAKQLIASKKKYWSVAMMQFPPTAPHL